MIEVANAVTWTESRNMTLLNDSTALKGPWFLIKVLDSDPSSDDLVEGMMWYNTTDGQLKLYDGSSIIAFDHV